MLGLLVVALLSVDGGTPLGPCREAVDICFSPDGACDLKIAALIGRTKTTLEVSIYSLNRESIVAAVLQVKARTPSPTVRIILDSSQIQEPRELLQLKRLLAAKIPMKRDTHSGIMHNKFVVRDGTEFATGSFNFTNNASQNNDENVLLWECPRNALVYQNRFNLLWAKFKDATDSINGKPDAGAPDGGTL